ncbi:PKD domain-containing protein [Myxococcota bacterium]|nr:PKD domain-containing protein [Myxococcota bacterium]
MTAILFLALTAPQAQAWTHTGWVWDRVEFPLPWYLSDHVTDQLPEDYQVQVLDDSINAWQRDAPCSQLSTVYMGVREGHWKTGASRSDAMNTMYYDDPALQNSDSAIGVTYTQPSSEFAFSLRDPNDPDVTNNYFYAYDSDIVFSQGYDFYTSQEVEDGACSGSNGFAIEAIATHEFGHLWGLGHTCEEIDVQNNECEDAAFYSATMFWQGTPCSNEPNSLDTQDIEAITSLYGPYATFDVGEGVDRFGGVPLEVCFELETKGVEEGSGELAVEWNFGDGTTSNEESPCHTYTEKGQFTVFITVTGTNAECGEYEYAFREPAYVLACEVPAPAEGFDGMFTYEQVEGTTYQMVNQADLSVYGCIDQVQWDVFQGGELVQSVSAWSPKIDFGAEGDFEVVLNLGGPGGVAAEKLEISVSESSGGCSSVPAMAGLLGALAGLGAAARRRRR